MSNRAAGGEAAQIGAFLIKACEFGWVIYKDIKTRPELRAELLAKTENPAGLSESKVGIIVDEIVDQLLDAKG